MYNFQNPTQGTGVQSFIPYHNEFQMDFDKRLCDCGYDLTKMHNDAKESGEFQRYICPQCKIACSVEK